MKSVSISFAIIGNLLILASCSNKHYAFVQPSTPVRYYSVPAVSVQPNATPETATTAIPELMASVATDLLPVATADYTPVSTRSEAPEVSNVQTANSLPTSLHPVHSRREAQ